MSGAAHGSGRVTLLALAWAGCGAGSEARVAGREDSTVGTGPDWRPVVEVLVERLALEPRERVFAVGRPGLHDQLPVLLAAEVARAGGVYLGTLSSEGPYGAAGDPGFRERAGGLGREELRELLADVPVGIMLPGATPGDPPYGAMQELLWESRGRHRTVHFHWGGAYEVEDRSFPIGAVAAALPAEGERISSTYERAVVETDYEALAAAQRDFEMAARAGEIRVTTAAGTDLSFRIGDRPLNRQDGDASGRRTAFAATLIDREIEIPAGAIRVAPIESTVRGAIVFPRSEWNGETVEGLRFELEEGRIVSVSAGSGTSAVEAELEAGGGSARRFREFGLGFNPHLAVPDDDPWLPYFGYGAGVVRLSLGDNSELGGAVEGDYVRWNFFLDASVRIDGEIWVDDGRLVR